jgi:carboxyl-terminal processing protease
MTRRSMFVTRWLIVSILAASCCSVVWADPVAPGPYDRQIVLQVVSLMKRDHLTRHPMDKEISERCLKNFLKTLDPMKLYFYQSDVDEFQKHQDELCDSIRRGDIGFAFTVFRTFLQRVDERLKTVEGLLAAPLDFNADEQMPDREAARYPVTPAEAVDRWRQRIKWDLLLLKTADKKEDKKEGKEAIEKLLRRYRSIAKRSHQIDSEELLETYLTAFTTSFDPHTDYMSPRKYKDFEIQMSLELDGIGASLQTDDSGYTLVKQIIPGGAAAKDGRLKLEDKVVGVGQGDGGEIVDVVDMKIRDVVDLIRGKRGTTVRLEVIPADGSGRKIYKITRERIELKNSAARGKVFDAGRKLDGKPYRVGVIRLPSFYRNMVGYRLGLPDFRSTTRDVRKILDDFKQQGVDAVVLDLRYNGGGALNEAISLTKLFVPDGPVVQVKGPDGRVQQPSGDRDEELGIAWSGPLVVVINKFSASASEILAGAIQDYGRGLIVGDRSTHGKGTVQSLLDVGEKLFGGMPNSPAMGALKITISQFYRPDGDSTQLRGVLADVELPSITTHLSDVSESDLDYALPFDKVASAGFQRLDDVNPALCDQLRGLSEQRVRKSEEFQKVVRNVSRYKEQRARRFVSLNEAKFLKERAESIVDKEEDSLLDNLNGQNDDIKRDYYLSEILAIAADFMNPQTLAKAHGAGAAAQN